MKVFKSDTCVICGKEPATTRDNVPPGCVFPQPRPSDLVRVPACLNCNCGSSQSDAEFQILLAAVAGHRPDGSRLFAQQTGRTFQKNRGLREKVVSRIRLADLRAANGSVVHNVPVMPTQFSHHKWVIERTIRGLHFHHSGHILGDTVTLSVLWHMAPPDFPNLPWTTCSMGGDQFIYKYILLPEHPVASAWLFQFFGRLWASGYAIPREVPSESARRD